jgi:hypothetical protein
MFDIDDVYYLEQMPKVLRKWAAGLAKNTAESAAVSDDHKAISASSLPKFKYLLDRKANDPDALALLADC